MNINAFITSAGHSGSTLLDMMLGAHPKCESLGELVHLPMDMAMNRPCGCGKPMRECDLWPHVMHKMGITSEDDPYKLDLGYVFAMVGDKKRSSSLHRNLTRAKNALKYTELRWDLDWLGYLTPGFNRGINNTLDVYEHIRNLTNKEVIVDSSKHYLRAVGLHKNNPEKTRVIVLVRDGRGVFNSWLKRGFGRDRSLKAWRNHYQNMHALFEKHIEPSHRIVVHYEDLVQKTETTLENICSFLHIEFANSMTDFRSTVHHNVNGNDMKYLTSSSLRLDESWKKSLAKEDLAYFEKRAGALNKYFGYM